MSATADLLDLTVHVGEERVQYYLLFVVVTGSICRLRPAGLVFKFFTGLKSGNMFFNLLLILYLRLLSRSSDIWIFFARSSPKSQNVTKNVLLKFHLNKASLMDFLCCCSSLTQVRTHSNARRHNMFTQISSIKGEERASTAEASQLSVFSLSLPEVPI